MDVVAFDMCASTTILEQLILRRQEMRLDAFWTKMVDYLQVCSRPYGPLKSTSSWVTVGSLFPAKTKGGDLLDFLTDFSKFFRKHLQILVLKDLDFRPEVTGLTVGLEMGRLRSLKMNGLKEHVGRPITIACRLVKAIKQRDQRPAYKGLASRQVYNEYFKPFASQVNAKRVRQQLHDISGGENFTCIKMTLMAQ